MKTFSKLIVIPTNCKLLVSFKFSVKNLAIIWPIYQEPLQRCVVVNTDTNVAAIFNTLPRAMMFISQEFLIIDYFSDVLSAKFSKIFITQINRLERLIFNVSFGHYSVLQFIGFRYRQRWNPDAQVLKYRLGYNKKVWFRCPADFVSVIKKVHPKKRFYFFFSYQVAELMALIRAIKQARPGTLYKGLGVNFKEQPMVLKEGKKALW